MNTNFKIGDVVQLPSGGPELTISEIKETGEIICHRFDENHTLHTESMKVAEVVYRSDKIPEISVNDVVSTYAKGGPSLSVVAINDPMIDCVWRDKNNVIQTASFRKEELDKKSDGWEDVQFTQASYMSYK